ATYKANPAPMALWAETVYEVQRSGEPVGTISINTDTNTAGGWQGHGELRLKGAEPKRKASAAGSSPSATSDEPPRLRRSGGTPNSSTPSQPASQPTPAPTPQPSSGASQPTAPSTTASAPAPSTQPNV